MVHGRSRHEVWELLYALTVYGESLDFDPDLGHDQTGVEPVEVDPVPHHPLDLDIEQDFSFAGEVTCL
ncbi:hypothetical protein MRX96_025511 [Rhipicephalus microplus]